MVENWLVTALGPNVCLFLFVLFFALVLVFSFLKEHQEIKEQRVRRENNYKELLNQFLIDCDGFKSELDELKKKIERL